MSKLQQAHEIGQSIWLDFIDRAFLDSGGLKDLVDDGLRGVTSNPSIFEKAISKGDEYDEDIARLVAEGKSDSEIYEALAIADIQQAADVLRPVYDQSGGADGFVSLEVNPELAYDTGETIKEARHLFKTVDRPNVMIKVPATAAGIPAIATLTGEGININITLMFSLTHYDAVADAYIRGLERLLASGGDVSKVSSVASFFVSRVDSEVDEQLAENGSDEAKALLGTIGIANSKLAYTRYLNAFSSERWGRLAAQGARPQRILYGSTSTKNPDYPDTLYVDGLMGPSTVNTLPLDTIDAMRERGTISPALTTNLDEARQQLVQLDLLGIDLEEITQQLQDVGVIKFADSFRELMGSIRQASESLKAAAPA
jgi:transaldolase